MNARDIQNRGAATTISKRASAGASSEGLGGLRGFLTRYHAGNISAAGGIGNRCRAAPDAFRPWASYTGLLAGCGCGAPASFPTTATSELRFSIRVGRETRSGLSRFLMIWLCDGQMPAL